MQVDVPALGGAQFDQVIDLEQVILVHAAVSLQQGFSGPRLGRRLVGCGDQRIGVLLGKLTRAIAADIDEVEMAWRLVLGFRRKRDAEAFDLVDHRVGIHMQATRRAEPLVEQLGVGIFQRMAHGEGDVMQFDPAVGCAPAQQDGEKVRCVRRHAVLDSESMIRLGLSSQTGDCIAVILNISKAKTRRGRLTPARRRLLDRLFAELLELSPAERQLRMGELALRCPRLVAWLQRLLDAMAETTERLESPLGKMADDLTASHAGLQSSLPPGTRLGSWEVVEPVGAGGMGVVYRVARADGAFDMVAAAKLIRMRRDARLEVRLAIERQLLARLDHPNIARIVDGGTSDSGQPFLVMEWVPGADLSERATTLKPEERLSLFAEIAAAVAHAHQRSVIHGDIKPANVRLGADGRIRLLDFGIARLALDEEGDQNTTIAALTPAFAAPEQLAGRPASTQSDVWGLGALLTWLLAGEVFERGLLGDVRTLERALRPRVARAGDLAAIIGRACAEDPAQRYAGVPELLDDLDRHRRWLPVSARPATRRYLLDRFIRRNPLGVGLGSLSVLLLLAGLAGVSWQAHVAGLERDRAQQQRDLAELQAAKTQRVSEFVVGLFEQADPYLRPGGELTARDLLRQGRERIETLDEAPLVQAEMHQVLARVHRSLAEHETAYELASQALALLAGQPEVDRESLAAAWSVKAGTLASLGRYAQAEQAHRQALVLTDPERPLVVAERLNNLGLAAYSLGRLGEAESLLETALQLRQIGLPDSAELAASYNNLALVLAAQDRRAEAEPLYQEALAIRRSVLGENHPTTTYSLTNLATLLAQLERWDEAEAAYLEALALRRGIFGDEHPAVASVLYQIGWLQSRRGELQPARQHLEEALVIRARVLGDEHPSTAVVLNALAGVARELNDVDQAEYWLRRALVIYREAYGDSHHDIALVLANLGLTRHAAGDREEAERLLLEALAMNRQELGEAHRHVADNLMSLAEVQYEAGRAPQALAHARAAVAVLDSLGLGRDHPARARAERLVAAGGELPPG